MPRRALIISDPQVDFCTPGGKAALPNGDLIIPVIEKLKMLQHALPRNGKALESFYDVVVITGESRPSTVQPAESDGAPKTTDFCLEGDRGAAFHPHLTFMPSDLIKMKGRAKDLEWLSAFDDPSTVTSVDQQTKREEKKSELHKLLCSKRVLEIDVVGVALETCVKRTAEVAARLGYHTRIITDGVASMDPSKTEEVLLELRKEYGVYWAHSSEVVKEAKWRKAKCNSSVPRPPKYTEGQ